jgi:hypothetical protein
MGLSTYTVLNSTTYTTGSLVVPSYDAQSIDGSSQLVRTFNNDGSCNFSSTQETLPYVFGKIIFRPMLDKILSFGTRTITVVSSGFGIIGSIIDGVVSKAFSFLPVVEASDLQACEGLPSDSQLEILKKLLKVEEDMLKTQNLILEKQKEISQLLPKILKEKEKETRMKEFDDAVQVLEKKIDSLNDKIWGLHKEIGLMNIQIRQTPTQSYEHFPNGGGKTVENPEYVRLQRENAFNVQNICELCNQREILATKINNILGTMEKELKINLSDRKVSKECHEIKEIKCPQIKEIKRNIQI